MLTLRNVDDGAYTIRWYDPQNGTWQDEEAATAHGGRLSICIPSFGRDLAAMIVPNP